MKKKQKRIICLLLALLLVFMELSVKVEVYAASSDDIYSTGTFKCDWLNPLNSAYNDVASPIDFSVEEKVITGNSKHYLTWSNPEGYEDSTVEVYAQIYVNYIDTDDFSLSEEELTQDVWNEVALPVVKCCEVNSSVGGAVINFSDLWASLDMISTAQFDHYMATIGATAFIDTIIALIADVDTDFTGLYNEMATVYYLINDSMTANYIKYSRVKYFVRYVGGSSGTGVATDEYGKPVRSVGNYYYEVLKDTARYGDDYAVRDIVADRMGAYYYSASSSSGWWQIGFSGNTFYNHYNYVVGGEKYYYILSEEYLVNSDYCHYNVPFSTYYAISSGATPYEDEFWERIDKYPAMFDKDLCEYASSVPIFANKADCENWVMNGVMASTAILPDGMTLEDDGTITYQMCGKFVENDSTISTGGSSSTPDDDETGEDSGTDNEENGEAAGGSGDSSGSGNEGGKTDGDDEDDSGSSGDGSGDSSGDDSGNSGDASGDSGSNDDNNNDDTSSGDSSEGLDEENDIVYWLKKIYERLGTLLTVVVVGEVADFATEFLEETVGELTSAIDAVSSEAEDKFPFSIIYVAPLVIMMLASEPVTPGIEIDLASSDMTMGMFTVPGIDFSLTLDFSMLDPLAELLRYMETILFLIALGHYTFKAVGMIKGGITE